MIKRNVFLIKITTMEAKNESSNIQSTTGQKYLELKEVDSKKVYDQLAEFTRIARYAQYNSKAKRRETWQEQVERVFKMHKVKYAKCLDNSEFMEAFNFAKNMMLEKRVLGSQRALQFGGPAILNKNARIYNCFSADTQFWTEEGLVDFTHFEDGDKVMVRTRAKWMPATVKNFGKENLLKLTIKKKSATREIYTTENHRWIVKSLRNKPFGVKSTIELKEGDILQKVCPKTNISRIQLCPIGLQHGIVYGDGTYDKKIGNCRIHLCGEKTEMKKYFFSERKDNKTITGLPSNFKTLPSLDMNKEYLYGFLAGWFATDGSVDKSGRMTLSNSNKGVLEWCRAAFFKLDIITGEISISREKSPFDSTSKPSFRINIVRKNIPKEFYVYSKHSERYKAAKENCEWKVQSIETTDRFEDVWCVVEPVYEEFTLECGVLTKNCAATYVDRTRVFQEVMFSLLCGVGMGFSVQLHHIAKLPGIAAPEMKEKVVYDIADSIEGWSDAIGVLLSAYFVENQTFPEYHGKTVTFNYDLIRPKGSPISHMGGKAPGPDGLRSSIDKIRELLERCIKEGRTRLRPIDAYDILMHCSDAVLSGGIRRAATIALFSLEDEEMIKAKTGDWYITNPQRARSNNSALLLRDSTPKEKFMDMIESVKQFGEPGMIFADNKETLFNPCVPDDTWVMTSEGSRQVRDLIEKPFTAVVDGKEYKSPTGFVKTGHKQVYKIITKEGYEVRATDNHKIMTADRDWVELKNLEAGDRITIHDHSERKLDIKETPNFAKGWIIGSLYGDGTFHYPTERACLCYWGENRHEMRDKAYEYFKQLNWITPQSRGGYESKNVEVGKIVVENARMHGESQKYISKGKVLLDQVEKESMSFQAGFLRGIFDADGSVQGTQKKGISIRLTSNSLDTLKRVQRMALRLGVYGKIYRERRPEGEYMLPDGKGGMKMFHCKAVHEFIISRSSIQMYNQNIGFNEKEKQTKLDTLLDSYKRRPYGSKYVAEIVDIVPDEVCDVYDCTVEEVHAFDANGVYVHNCVEISLYGYDSAGNSGIQMCNLSEINMGIIKSPEDFYKACEAGAILGTLQAGYTDFGYLGKVTQSIVEREALTGVSMTGMMDTPEIAFNPETLRTGAEKVKEVNKKLAAIIGINQASRTTCVKPAGSTSCILGTASGIHPRHAKRYFRRVQVNKLEEPLEYFKKFNPQAVEESVWSTGRTDDVITFLCKSNPNSLTKKDVSALNLLEKVKLVQEHWVTGGKNTHLCVDEALNHNVSNTITVAKNEWDTAAEFIYNNRNYFAGISMLSASGDMVYQQAPFQEVFSHTEIADMYGAGSVFASGLIVHAHDAFDGNLYNACSCFLGYGEKLEMPKFDMNNITHSFVDSDKTYKKIRWIAQADKFTKRHFNGNKEKMTHCLKAVDAWHKWCNLKRTYQNVPWEEFYEEKNNTKASEYVACSSGQCELVRF